METIQSGFKTGLKSNTQQEVSVVFSYLSLSTSSQGQLQEIMVVVNGLQDPYLVNLDISTSENPKISDKLNIGLSINNRYDMHRFKCTDLYQELEGSLH